MYQPGILAQIIKEMEIYNIYLLGLSEVQWNGSGQYRIPNDILLYYKEFAGSISRRNFIGLKTQYTTVNYNQ
jgi:hypothetical protein